MGVQLLRAFIVNSGGVIAEIAGLAANRPTPANAVQTIYFATDTGAISYSNGTSWVPLGGGGGGGTSPLVPTAVKTANYTLSAQDLVPFNTTSGNLVATLPNAPADKVQVAVKMIIQSGSNTVTINTAGSDVFNKTGGGTSLTLKLLNQGVLLQYSASGGIWYVISDDLPLTQLDNRYGGVAQTMLGFIYNKQAWTPATLASDFSGTTATVSAATGNIVFTGSGLLPIAYYSCLQYWKQTVNFSPDLVNGTASLVKVGIQIGHSSNQNVAYAAFDYSTGAGRGTVSLVLGLTPGAVVIVTPALSFSQGDNIQLSIERIQDVMTVTATNLTTGTSSVTASYTFNGSNFTNIPNTGKYTIGTTSSNQITVKSIIVGSTETVNNNVTFIGDSITEGGLAADLPSGFARIAANYFTNTVIVAGGYDTTQDVLNRMPEILSLKPKQAVLLIGTNDIIGGVPSATWHANFASIVSQLQAAGILDWIIDGSYNTTGATNVLYNYTTANYTNLIAAYINGSVVPGSVAGDGVHPSTSGHSIIFSSIIAANVLVNGTNNVPGLYFNNLFSRGNITVGNQTPTVMVIPNFIDLGASYNSVALSQLAYKLRVFDDGTNTAGIGIDANGLYYGTYSGLHQYTIAGVLIGTVGDSINWHNTSNSPVSSASPVQINLGNQYFPSANGGFAANKFNWFCIANGSLYAGVGFNVSNGTEFNQYALGYAFRSAGNLLMSVTNAGVFSPTSTFLAAAGTALAAAINIPIGVLLTTPVIGSLESDNTANGNLYFTIADGSRQIIAYLGAIQSFTNKNLSSSSNVLGTKGNSTTTGTATTTVTVTVAMGTSSYFVAITPVNALTAVNYYISAKTPTSFTVTFLTALTGSISFDYFCTN